MNNVRLRRLRANLNLIYQKARKLLHSKTMQEFGVFLCFLILALFFWLLLSLKETTQASLTLPVHYQLPPKAILTSSPPPAKIKIQLRDKGSVLLQYYLNGLQPITLDCERYAQETGISKMGFSQIAPHIRQQLFVTTSLLSIAPDSIACYFTHQGSKKLPLRVPRKLSALPHCKLDTVVLLSQDSVSVYAPPTLLNSLTEIFTDTLVEEALSDTLKTTLAIRSSDGVLTIPDSIEATVFVEEYTSKRFTIPVVAIGLPAELSLLTFPASVELSCMMGISDFTKITATDFEVGINYENLLQHPGEKQSLQLFRYPPSVQNIIFEPTRVEYILEERTP